MTARRSNSCEVAVIGAGPYGLSVAAHLKHAGVETRVFGEPMAFWRRNMPRGMMLRSPWRATHISDPVGSLSLDAYASAHGVDSARLLPLEQFVNYGEWFQKHAVPDVDRNTVQLVDASEIGFRLTLAEGDVFAADRVVIATGLRNQDYRPPAFCGLPTALVSHTSEHAEFSALRGKRVAVIGRGQSACESAALLTEAGADAELIGRGDLNWLGAAPERVTQRSVASRLREFLKSPSEVGPFPLSWFVEVPHLVRFLPQNLRDEFTRRCLRPGAAAWLKPRFSDVTCTPGRTIKGARVEIDQVVVELDNGAKTFDHVLLGTGYQVDLARLGILSPRLLRKIARVQGSPVLHAGFESSVANLHFVGSYAVRSFGPLLRFIAGAPCAARAVTAAARGVAQRPVKYSDAAGHFGAAAPNLAPPQ